MEIHKEVISPVLDRVNSETGHDAARKFLYLMGSTPATRAILNQIGSRPEQYSSRLSTDLAGRIWDNPVLVGAGWDKTGSSIRGLYELGFAGIEVGSVLKRRQKGNTSVEIDPYFWRRLDPHNIYGRQFIIAPGVGINRLGFNSPGMARVARNINRVDPQGIVPIGISIGKNKTVPNHKAPQVHADVAKFMYDLGSYFAFNPASPNTPNLRELLKKILLRDNVQAINGAMEEKGGRKPLFVKVHVDMTREELDEVIEVALDEKATGIITSNTTTNAERKAKYGPRWANQEGGFSGDDPEYRQESTEQIAYIYNQVGSQLQIIGVGGVKDGPTALEKIKAGATAVQVVTALRGEGLSVAANINRQLIELMDQEGVYHISELIGVDAHLYR